MEETNKNAVATPKAIVVETPLFVVKDNTPLALAISLVMDKAKALRNDKGNYTVEYFCDDMLTDAVSGFNRYLDANEERKNREAFTKSMNALTVPDMTKPAELKTYVERVEALQRKFRQGSYKPKDGL